MLPYIAKRILQMRKAKDIDREIILDYLDGFYIKSYGCL